jgi:hypothetical protein
MIFNVRWTPLGDSKEYRSRNRPTARDATDFACAILDQMAVHEIRVTDAGGQHVMMMPEILRYWRAKQPRPGMT